MLLLHAQAASFANFESSFLLVDTGANDTTVHYKDQIWLSDKHLISTGRSKLIKPAIDVQPFMTSLRYFPKGAKNCYQLSLYNHKFLFRAGKSINVILMDGEIPFISSLEATSLDKYTYTHHPLYRLMKNGTAFHLLSRTNYGGYNRILPPWSGTDNACEERLNRYWTPKSVPGYLNYSFSVDSCIGMYYENRAPDTVMRTFIVPPTASDSIFLSVDFPTNDPQSTYFVFYFLDVKKSRTINETRKVDIYIDGALKSEMEIKDGIIYVVSLYPVLVQGTANVTISPANGSVLPPILNGMEVFIARDLLQEKIETNDFESSFLLVDTGANDTTVHYKDQIWLSDKHLISTGRSKLIKPAIDVQPFMTSLRYFPKGAKNCYQLSLYNHKFLFRAGKSINVILMDGEIPFISSLEATSLDKYTYTHHPLYRLMKNGTAFHLLSRTNYGGYNRILPPWSGMDNACEERLNRYWTPKSVPGYLNYSFSVDSCIGMYYENRAPDTVMRTFIVPPTASDSIFLSVDFPTNDPQSTYFVFYFLDVKKSRTINETRKVDIYIDGALKSEMEIKDGIIYVVSLYPVLVQGTANVTISPANGSVLPPILNGMEVFIARDLLQEKIETNGGLKMIYSFIVVLGFHVFSFLILFA
ncbi:unnamed protein product [Ilex paraguariensis]|uniref:Malectin-like domain-containing protein n=1 Tax=Ilex paraguariensis TaxID=185542 RepID=A0ABC8SKF2_9AQUA